MIIMANNHYNNDYPIITIQNNNKNTIMTG